MKTKVGIPIVSTDGIHRPMMDLLAYHSDNYILWLNQLKDLNERKRKLLEWYEIYSQQSKPTPE